MSSYNETDPVPKDLDLSTPTEGATPPAEVNNAIRESKRVLKIGSAIITTTGNLQLTEQHSTVLINGAHTITLPTIADVSSSTFTKRYRIINISASTGVLKTKAGGETLNGNNYASTGLNLAVQYAEYLIYGNGTVWYMEAVGKFGTVTTDTISELTGAAGVTIDGMGFKNGSPNPTSWPSFSVHRNGVDQNNITGRDKIEWTTEVFDTNSNFDKDTNFRFTPTVGGKYLFTVKVIVINVTVGDGIVLEISKNGLTTAFSTVQLYNVGATIVPITITGINNANGTTDYYEVFLTNNARDTSDVFGGSNDTQWMGSRIA